MKLIDLMRIIGRMNDFLKWRKTAILDVHG